MADMRLGPRPAECCMNVNGMVALRTQNDQAPHPAACVCRHRTLRLMIVRAFPICQAKPLSLTHENARRLDWSNRRAL